MERTTSLLSADLLPHRYRPDCIDRVRCHLGQALRLKQWIQDFISLSKTSNNLDYNDDSSASEFSEFEVPLVASKCILITGPPGVGKTSLVYTVANELKLHVVESHSSEKRDSKLFSMLKLTNQKGKINPIAKLFNATSKQQQQQLNTRRKRRKLGEANNHSSEIRANQPQCLSLSGDASIILFDDVDVVFEDDGPFLRSLVEFIKESKRPVVLTATQSIDQIIKALGDQYTQHIHLDKPLVEDCARLLEDVCRNEKYHRLSKTSGCQTIARHYDCDIRQCLNRIHFYGDQADQITEIELSDDFVLPEFSRINLEIETTTGSSGNKLIMNCYSSSSIVDLMDARFNLVNRSTLLGFWLEGRPSTRNEEQNSDLDLGEQIRDSIVELTRKLHFNELKSSGELRDQEIVFKKNREQILTASTLINEKIKSRIEPPEKEFFIDIIPVFCELAELEARLKTSGQDNGGSSRRTRRTLSYLDSIYVYLEPEDITVLTQGMLKPQCLMK